MLEFRHIGIPTQEQKPNEVYVAGAKVFVTNPEESPYKIEYLRFEAGSPMPELLQKGVHVSFEVNDLDLALKDQKVLVPPFEATPTLRVAFIEKDGMAIELMAAKK